MAYVPRTFEDWFEEQDSLFQESYRNRLSGLKLCWDGAVAASSAISVEHETDHGYYCRCYYDIAEEIEKLKTGTNRQ